VLKDETDHKIKLSRCGGDALIRIGSSFGCDGGVDLSARVLNVICQIIEGLHGRICDLASVLHDNKRTASYQGFLPINSAASGSIFQVKANQMPCPPVFSLIHTVEYQVQQIKYL
jgi:hypothetical protein